MEFLNVIGSYLNWRMLDQDVTSLITLIIVSYQWYLDYWLCVIKKFTC